METNHIESKVCSGCPEKGVQPASNFSFRPNRNSLRARCKTCEKESAAAYRKRTKGIHNISKEEMEYREAGRKRMLELYPDRNV